MARNADIARRIARQIDGGGEVFRNHIADFLTTLKDDPEQLRQTLIHHHQDRELLQSIRGFRKYYLDGLDETPVQEPSQKTLGMMKAKGMDEGEVMDLVIAEIIHRRKWEKVMKDNPETLDILGQSVKPGSEPG